MTLKYYVESWRKWLRLIFYHMKISTFTLCKNEKFCYTFMYVHVLKSYKSLLFLEFIIRTIMYRIYPTKSH
jgi:hypothetical protein